MKQIADQAYIGDFEDRRFPVLVDRDDRACILDAGQMLDRPGDSDGEINLGRNDLARLTDLHLVGRVARIDGRTRRADRGAELVGETKQQLEVLGAAERSSPGDDLRRRLQIGPVGRAGFRAEVARVCGQAHVEHPRFDAGAAAGTCRLEGRHAHGRDELPGGIGLHRDDRVARVDRPPEAMGALDRHEIADLGNAEQRRDTRREVLAETRRGAEHMRVIGRERDDLRRKYRRERVFVLGPIDAQHLVHAVNGGGLRCNSRGVRAEQRDRDLGIRDPARTGDALERREIERLAVVFTDDEYFGH